MKKTGKTGWQVFFEIAYEGDAVFEPRTRLFLVFQQRYQQDSASFQKAEKDIRGHSVLPR